MTRYTYTYTFTEEEVNRILESLRAFRNYEVKEKMKIDESNEYMRELYTEDIRETQKLMYKIEKAKEEREKIPF